MSLYSNLNHHNHKLELSRPQKRITLSILKKCSDCTVVKSVIIALGVKVGD